MGILDKFTSYFRDDKHEQTHSKQAEELTRQRRGNPYGNLPEQIEEMPPEDVADEFARMQQGRRFEFVRRGHISREKWSEMRAMIENDPKQQAFWGLDSTQTEMRDAGEVCACHGEGTLPVGVSKGGQQTIGQTQETVEGSKTEVGGKVAGTGGVDVLGVGSGSVTGEGSAKKGWSEENTQQEMAQSTGTGSTTPTFFACKIEPTHSTLSRRAFINLGDFYVGRTYENTENDAHLIDDWEMDADENATEDSAKNEDEDTAQREETVEPHPPARDGQTPEERYSELQEHSDFLADENEALDNEIDDINGKVENYNGIKDNFEKRKEEYRIEKYELYEDIDDLEESEREAADSQAKSEIQQQIDEKNERLQNVKEKIETKDAQIEDIESDINDERQKLNDKQEKRNENRRQITANEDEMRTIEENYPDRAFDQATTDGSEDGEKVAAPGESDREGDGESGDVTGEDEDDTERLATGQESNGPDDGSESGTTGEDGDTKKLERKENDTAELEEADSGEGDDIPMAINENNNPSSEPDTEAQDKTTDETEPTSTDDKDTRVENTQTKTGADSFPTINTNQPDTAPTDGDDGEGDSEINLPSAEPTTDDEDSDLSKSEEGRDGDSRESPGEADNPKELVAGQGDTGPADGDEGEATAPITSDDAAAQTERDGDETVDATDSTDEDTNTNDSADGETGTEEESEPNGPSTLEASTEREDVASSTENTAAAEPEREEAYTSENDGTTPDESGSASDGNDDQSTELDTNAQNASDESEPTHTDDDDAGRENNQPQRDSATDVKIYSSSLDDTETSNTGTDVDTFSSSLDDTEASKPSTDVDTFSSSGENTDATATNPNDMDPDPNGSVESESERATNEPDDSNLTVDTDESDEKWWD